MKKGTGTRVRLQTKLAFAFALLAAFTSSLVTLNLFLTVRAQLRENTRERLEDAVGIAAFLVDTETHDRLVDPSDEGNADYLRVRSDLQNIRNSATDIRYVYTMRRGPDGGIVFVVDAETIPEEIAHLGEVYTDASEFLKANFEKLERPVVETDFYTDRWGTWLTGYAPFYDSQGQRRGVLGMDIDAKQVINHERQFLWIALSLLGGTMLVALVLGWFLGRRLAAPIVSLTRGAELVSHGDLSHVVSVRSHDETAELADSFNSMTRQVKSSLDDLRRYRDHLEELVERRTLKLTQANAKLRKQERIINNDLELARRIQERFLPTEFPFTGDLRCASFYRACSLIGGDLFDVFPITPRIAGFYVADVSGHGVSAALVTAIVKIFIDHCQELLRAGQVSTTGQIKDEGLCNTLNELNTLADRVTHREGFITIQLGALNLDTGILVLANAGHNPPVLWSRETAKCRELRVPANLVIGMTESFDYQTAAFQLIRGDKLLAYTDGITERFSPDRDEFGREQLLAEVNANGHHTPSELLDKVIRVNNSFAADLPPGDDLAMLVIEYL